MYFFCRNTRREPPTIDKQLATGKLYHLRLRVKHTLFVICKTGRESYHLIHWPTRVLSSVDRREITQKNMNLKKYMGNNDNIRNNFD
jgi:hypothetical protein